MPSNRPDRLARARDAPYRLRRRSPGTGVAVHVLLHEDGPRTMKQPPIDRDASDHGQAVIVVRRAEDGVEVEVGRSPAGGTTAGRAPRRSSASWSLSCSPVAS